MLSYSVVCDSLQPHGLQPRQASLSMGFPRQEYWSGLPFPPLGDLTQGSNPCLLLLLQGQADSLPQVPSGKARSGRMDTRTWTCMAEALCCPPEATTTLLISYHFGSVAQSCLTLCNPMDCSTPGVPVHHQLSELAQTHVHGVGDGIQPFYPLSSPSPPTFNLSQQQRLFQ